MRCHICNKKLFPKEIKRTIDNKWSPCSTCLEEINSPNLFEDIDSDLYYQINSFKKLVNYPDEDEESYDDI